LYKHWSVYTCLTPTDIPQIYPSLTDVYVNLVWQAKYCYPYFACFPNQNVLFIYFLGSQAVWAGDVLQAWAFLFYWEAPGFELQGRERCPWATTPPKVLWVQFLKHLHKKMQIFLTLVAYKTPTVVRIKEKEYKSV